MKKLNLKLDGVKAQLTKEQMKKVNGGYYTCFCLIDFIPNDPPMICEDNYDACSAIADVYCYGFSHYQGNYICY